jgi:Holliday junction resolvasome RuvABC endonuclease subunit
MSTMFLGIDLGTQCGWAALCVAPDRGIASAYGTWDCSFRSGIDSASVRIEKFEKNLTDILAVGVDKVFYEIVRRHNGVQASHVYGALKSKMQEVCDAHDVPYEGLGVQEIKKFATGKGNASKQDMIDAARRRGFTIPYLQDNTADAVCIALCGWETKS